MADRAMLQSPPYRGTMSLKDRPWWPAWQTFVLAAVIALVTSAVILFVVYWHPGGSATSSGDVPANNVVLDLPSSGHPTPVDVQVAKPKRRDVTYSISLPANVAPLYQTTLYAKVSGYLKWIGPDKGDAVKKGEVLAIIDAPEVEEQYHQAVADYKIKQITYQRLANVWKETPEVIAKQDVDVAEAALAAAKHVMEQRIAYQDYLKLRAPYAGVITARFADPGALIQVATSSATNAIPLFTIMDLETVRVYTNVPQEDASLVKPGMTEAVITLKELPDQQFKSPVTRTTSSLDPSTRTLLVEIDLPNQEHTLQPGTFAEVSLKLRTSPHALVVPAGAVVTNGKTKTVFIAESGRARLVPIRTGISDGSWVEVIEGLTGTEDVVVVGQTKLTEGTLLKASPYNLPEGTPGIQKYEQRASVGLRSLQS
jgi:membrane fusion protein, multidrug efflux system